MDQTSTESTHILQGDTKAVDALLKNLWDRTKKAAEMISRLREEKAELQARVASMEGEFSRLKQDVVKNEDMIRSLSAERAEGNHSFVSNGERELISARVKDLLARLDGYV